ncbi:MAG: DnaA N-terminal domain-containing protein, partial [Pseudomonadota bacterium]
MLRLIALVTARYNWRSDELSIGQRDIARMWSVNERTVKREIKRLLGYDILIRKRAGVRGRVATYRLNYAKVAEISKPSWLLVGPDFDLRMRGRYRDLETKVVSLGNYVRAVEDQPVETSPGTWARVMSDLHALNPSLHSAWFAQLTFVRHARGELRLSAPTTFIQRYVETHLMSVLLHAVEAEMGVVDTVVFE